MKRTTCGNNVHEINTAELQQGAVVVKVIRFVTMALFQACFSLMVVQHFGVKPFIYLSPHDMFHLYTMCEFAYVWFVQ